MTDYTPSTDQVRDAWTYASTGGESDRTYQEAADLFNLWLAAHEASIRERISQDIKAEESKIRNFIDFDRHKDSCVGEINGLRRAAQIVRGTTR